MSQMTLGEALRDEGTEQVGSNNATWREAALALITSLPSGAIVHGEFVRHAIGDPEHPNAIGSVFRFAFAGGLVVPDGFRASADPVPPRRDAAAMEAFVNLEALKQEGRALGILAAPGEDRARIARNLARKLERVAALPPLNLASWYRSEVLLSDGMLHGRFRADPDISLDELRERLADRCAALEGFADRWFAASAEAAAERRAQEQLERAARDALDARLAEHLVSCKCSGHYDDPDADRYGEDR